MRYKLEATEDVQRNVGDRIFNSKKGDTIELSAAGAEVALSQMMGGAFKHVESIPENDIEREKVELSATREKLLSTKKADLVKKAEKLNIEQAHELNKEPLADAILAAQTSAAAAADIKGTPGMDAGISGQSTTLDAESSTAAAESEKSTKDGK